MDSFIFAKVYIKNEFFGGYLLSEKSVPKNFSPNALIYFCESF